MISRLVYILMTLVLLASCSEKYTIAGSSSQSSLDGKMAYIKLMEDNIRQSEIRLHDIMQLQEEGIVTANDVLRSQMQLTRDKLALSEARHEWELLNQRLDLLLGLPEDLLISPDTSLLEQSLPLLGYPDYMEMAVANDPDLNLARKQTEFSKIGYRIEKTGYFPRLSAYASSTLARGLTILAPRAKALMPAVMP